VSKANQGSIIVIDTIQITEEQIVNQAKQGDRGAFGELVNRYYDSVIRVVYRLCGDMQLAQDAAQEAFIRAWVKLPEYQPRAPFKNWLFRIAVNVALDVLRKSPEESIAEEDQFVLEAQKTPNPETAYLEKEQADIMQTAIRSLPEAARTVLVLREYSQLTYDEIANVLDIPIGTVMSRLNYARNRLRELLKISWSKGV
jgi:RNA polymerase sigma-70 factor (ECF subfamily)